MIATFVFLALAAFVGCGLFLLIHTVINERIGVALIILLGAAVLGSTLFDILTL